MRTKRKNWPILVTLFLLLYLLVPACMASAANAVTISQSSATIQVGETLQLSAYLNGAASSASWGSSETSVATVSQSGAVTGVAPGSSVITAMVNGTSVECIVSVLKTSTSGTTRYNVLILDTSLSMKGDPLKKEKKAAERFCNKVLDSDGNNYIAVVTLNSSATVACKFTNDKNKLSKCINKVTAKGKTDFNKALKAAGNLLDNASDGTKVMKNIILCSDGLPQTGTQSASGKYSSKDHKNYKYANAAYKTDVKLKKKNYFVYALGFFHNSSGNDLVFGKKLMKDLASKNKYYVVTDVKKIDAVFEDIADTITETTISKKTLTLYVGESATLTVQKDGETQSASWSSSKTSIATVNGSGKVTGVKAGKTVITAKANGKTLTCTVTVKKKKGTSVTPTIKLSPTSTNVYVGKTVQLKATVTGKSKTVTWKSSDKKIATVTKSGKVKGVSEGTVTITATANGVSATCTVNVLVTHPEYSVYIKIPATKCSYGKVIDEVGDVIKVNDGAQINKCGAVFEKGNDGFYYAIVAFTGTNVTSANLVYYFARNGKMLYSNGYHLGNTNLSVYSMRKNSDGIWSVGGYYGSDRFNFYDANHKNIAAKGSGFDNKNVRLFSTKEEMIKWLKE